MKAAGQRKKTPKPTSEKGAIGSDTALDGAVGELGNLQKTWKNIVHQRESKVTELLAKLKDVLGDLEEQIAAQSTLILDYVERERVRLFKDSQTVMIPSGEIRIRQGRASVIIDGDEMGVIDLLEKKHLERFLRRNVEIDKNAILKDPEGIGKIPGIRIGISEQIGVIPLASLLEIKRKVTS